MWPENRAALEVFLAMRKCWRFGALGGVFGLDWPNVESRMRLMKVKATPELIADLDAMEDAALPLLNESDGD